MTVRKTCKWCIFLLTLLGLVGGWYAYTLYLKSDEILKQVVVKHISAAVPDLDVQIVRARFDFRRRVHLYGLSFRTKNDSQPIITFPEIVVTIDSKKLAEQQQIDVQKVVLKKPHINLVRDSGGTWNWQNLTPPPTGTMSLPEFEVERGTVTLTLDGTESTVPIQVALKNIDIKLIPSGKRRFLVTGLTQIDKVGNLDVNGKWDLDHSVWSVNGKWNDISLNQDLMVLLGCFSPELQKKLIGTAAGSLDQLPDPHDGLSSDKANRLEQKKQLPQAANTPMRIVLGGSERPATQSSQPQQTGTQMLGANVSAKVNVDFQVSVPEANAEPQYKILVELQDGQIEHNVLPFSLNKLQGKFYFDNRVFIVRDFHTSNGTTNIKLNGKLNRDNPDEADWFEVTANDLMLDYRLRRCLPYPLSKVYDTVQPAGPIDISFKLNKTTDTFGTVRWKPENLLVTAKHNSITHVKFPYPVTGITGTIKQEAENLVFTFEGLAGRRPVSIVGRINQPGISSETFVDIKVNQLAIDERLYAACPPESQSTLEKLRLRGTADAKVSLYRPPGPNRRFVWDLNANVYSGSLQFQGFPYPVHKLSGLVKHSGKNDTWTAEEIKGENGSTKLTGSAIFSKNTNSHWLNCTINAKQAHFDKQLEMALPKPLQKIWDELSPSGVIEDVTAKIQWSPNQPALVSLPKASIRKASFTLRSFPYPIENISSEMSYSAAENKLIIQSFSGNHDETSIRALGFGLFPPDADWRLRLEELFVDDLLPDRLFRRALPVTLREVTDSLNPLGPVSLAGMLELRGTGNDQDPVSAAWNVAVVLSDNTVSTGVDLKHLYGEIKNSGTWNGQSLEMDGYIDFESLVALGYEIAQLKGPFGYHNERLTLGASELLKPRGSSYLEPPVKTSRIIGNAIGGRLSIDGAATFIDDTNYHVLLTLNQGNMGDYAKRYMQGQRNLRGKIDAWVELYGKSSAEKDIQGRGQLQILPAALYELPMMVSIFNVLSFVPPGDKTAFKHAFAEFSIANSKFTFNKIDLVGDAIRLRGRGTARFDGLLDLKFYSIKPKNLLPIPLVNKLLEELTKGMVGVEVSGYVSNPKAKATTVPALNNAFQKFIGGLVQPANRLPPLRMPDFTTPPRPHPSRQLFPQSRKPGQRLFPRRR